MGEVYRAEDTRLRRTVALKFLAAGRVTDAGLRQRFLHEAQAAASLDHANICTVYEVDDQDGEIFLAMAYIDGPTLQKKISQRPLQLEEAVEIAIQIGEGLEAAHERGIVHRDIKSSNILGPRGGELGVAELPPHRAWREVAALLLGQRRRDLRLGAAAGPRGPPAGWRTPRRLSPAFCPIRGVDATVRVLSGSFAREAVCSHVSEHGEHLDDEDRPAAVTADVLRTGAIDAMGGP